MRRVLRNAVLALACLSGPAARADTPQLALQVDAAAPPRPAAVVPDILVTGQPNPLDRTDRRLALLSAALPLDAESATAEAPGWQGLAMRLGFPASPEAAQGEALHMMQRVAAPPAGPDPDAGTADTP